MVAARFVHSIQVPAIGCKGQVRWIGRCVGIAYPGCRAGSGIKPVHINAFAAAAGIRAGKKMILLRKTGKGNKKKKKKEVPHEG
jgi:hypothetical protein